jgi:terminase large subunit-like protein
MATKAKAPSVSFLEAIEDRRLLGLSLSPRQRDLVQLIEDNGLVVVAAGRQSGKSLLTAAFLVHNLLLRPDLDAMTASTTRRNGLCVATSQAQAGVVLNYARNLVERSPLLRSRLIRSDNEKLVFERGAIVTVPCDRRLMRGLVASAVVLDEFAHFHTESDGPRVADAIWAAVRPSIATFGEEGKILAISTPFGHNLFATLHAKAANGELPNAAAFQAGTSDMNPKIDATFLKGERVLLGPADFAREYEASFESSGVSFFDPAELQEVLVKPRQALPDEGRGWLLAIDPASGGEDPFGLALVAHDAREGYRGRLLVGHVECFAPRGGRRRIRGRSRAEKDLWLGSVLDRVAELSKRYGRAPVLSDQHIPQVIKEELAKRGVTNVKTIPWTPSLKSEAFQGLRARIATGRITIPSDEILVAELRRVRTRLRSGSSAVEIPRAGGSHGDIAMALAAGVHALDKRGVAQPLRGSSALVSRDRRDAFGPLGTRRPRRTSDPTGIRDVQIEPAADGRGASLARSYR